MRALLMADQLSVTWGGLTYPANAIADGAAFELLSDQPGPGWRANPDGDPRCPYRRFVHACEIDDVAGPAPTPPDAPILVPLRQSVTRDSLQRLSQSARPRPADRALLRAVHQSAAIACGTRMMKAISPEMVPHHLSGHALIRGFCYRHQDVAHLRTPEQLTVLGVGEPTADVCFALRWRAVAPADYAAPWADDFGGLLRMPASQRTGPPVLGGGFATSGDQLIPEHVTADFADIPFPVNAEIVAYLRDGTEAPLYRYLAEHMWARVANRRLEQVLGRIPDLDPDQRYHPVRAAPATRLVGRCRGVEHEVTADPPDEFRARARSGSDRHAATSVSRRVVRCATRAGDPLTVIAAGRGHLRVRACRPSPELAFRLDLRCLERGVYEGWLPRSQVADLREEDLPYHLPALAGSADAASAEEAAGTDDGDVGAQRPASPARR